MSRLVFAPSAENDLDEITRYIHEENPFAARRWFDAMVDKCRLLRDNPGIGRGRNFLPAGLSVLPVGHHLIIYRHLDDMVEIVRVVDARRDLPRFLSIPD